MLPGRLLYLFLIPGGLILPGVWALLRHSPRPLWLESFLPSYPWAVLGLGVLLGWRFNRTRLIFTLLLFLLAERALQLGVGGGRGVFAAVALLLPLNLLWIGLAKERGLLTPLGMTRVGLLLLQPVVVDIWLRLNPAEAKLWLTHPIFPPDLLPKGFSLPHPALAAFLLVFLVLTVRFLMRPAVLEGAFPWVLGAAAIALWRHPAGEATLWLASGGLVLTVAVIEASYFMAFRDELTGLPARRALNEYLLRAGSQYTLAMVDVDHFKKVNDTHGHDVGDQVLRMVASRLAEVTGGGKAFRYGGEEFTVVFPGRGIKEVLPHLEVLRESVGEAQFLLRGAGRPKKKPKRATKVDRTRRMLSVTVSIGVAERSERLPEDDQVFKAADQALYRAKKGGRNQVCH